MAAHEQMIKTFERELRRLAAALRYSGEIDEADIQHLKRAFTEVVSSEETPDDGEKIYRQIAARP